MKRSRQTVFGIFPLKVGNRISGTGTFTYNSTGTFVRTCSVNRQVNLTVPAGNFDAYEVECLMEYEYPSGKNMESDRVWYAPKIGHWVAIDRHGRMFLLESYDKS